MEIKKQPLVQPESFFAQEAKFISDMSLGLSISFKPGDGWKIDPETGEGFFDPKFFTEKGYSRGQAMFACAHEIDHVVELSQMLANPEGREIHARRKTLLQNNRRLHILQSYIKDVADNRRIIRRAPALEEEILRLYREKLWPSKDFKDMPKHLQFASAILRQEMLPDELVEVDLAVEEVIDKLRHVKGRSGQERDIIKIITSSDIDLATKIKLIERYVEPIYENLFEQDKQQQENASKETEENQEENFKDDYDKADQGMPHAFNEDEIEAAASSAVGSSISDRQKTAYEKEQGVTMEDTSDYYKEYQKIERYIEENRKPYRKIIEERLIPVQRLGDITDEGVIIEPGLAAIAQEEFNRGNINPMVFRDFEGRIITEEVPGVFELTGVFDRSHSMKSGGKKEEQRRAAILLMEAVQDFMYQPEVRKKMLKPPLTASSEIRSFGGVEQNVVIKPLSPELTERQRIKVFKVLDDVSGGATEDYVVLSQIIDEMKKRETMESGYLDRVKKHGVKKIIAVFSDGASSNQGEFDKKRKELEEMGVTIVDYRGIKDGTNFTSQMAKILENAVDSLCYTKKRPQ